MKGYSLTLALQPIIDLLTGSVKHYEGLVRIKNHQRFGNSHGAMLCEAELEGWIDKVDVSVIGQAINILRHRNIQLAVNLSPRTLEVAELEIRATLERARDVCGRLIIEITESAEIRDLDAVCRFIAGVREVGCGIAVDDFGSETGYFTDEIVRAIRPNFLKLDRNVFESEAEGTNLIARAAYLANYSNAEMIAEFIDSDAKERLIIALGIRYAQGHLYGIATPWKDLTHLPVTVKRSVGRASGNAHVVVALRGELHGA